MNRTEAKARLTQLRKDIDAKLDELNGLVDKLCANEITPEAAIAREIEIKEQLAALNAEFKRINSLPCCNI